MAENKTEFLIGADSYGDYEQPTRKIEMGPRAGQIVTDGAKLYVDCETCQSYKKALLKNGTYFGPSHSASQFCRSGKRPHCTCDTCF